MKAGCPCECNSGGFCGGCGHAGCGGRRMRRWLYHTFIHVPPAYREYVRCVNGRR